MNKHTARAFAATTIGTVLFFGLACVDLQAATVTVDEPNKTVGPNEPFTLNLIGLDFPVTLDGGGINVSFDPFVVEVLEVRVDTDTWEFFSDNGDINNFSGSIIGIVFNSFQDRTGDLPFASIDFLPVGPGVSTLELEEYVFNPFATGGERYPDLIFDQSIVIQVIPVPAAIWLLASALGVVGWLGRRRLV